MPSSPAKPLQWSYRGAIEAGTDTSGHAACEMTRPIARLTLAHAQIGAALQAYRLEAAVRLLIDLSAAQIYTLDDDHAEGGSNEEGAPFPQGWGGSGEDAPQLDLDGLVYQRIERFPFVISSSGPLAWLRRQLAAVIAGISSVIGRFLPSPAERQTSPDTATPKKPTRGEQDIATPRKDWLNRQYKPRPDAFYPQPYRHLATVLRNQGHAEAARRIAIEESDKTSRGVAGFLRRWTWGFFFGYGLLPGRSLLTLGGALALGWVLVHNTYKASAMEPTPDEIQTMAAEQPPGQALPEADRLCRPGAKIEISSILYAADLALPVVPLHQEERCEVIQQDRVMLFTFAGFAILGKLITALTLITFSGVMKPKDD
jgi:hypothetical protein